MYTVESPIVDTPKSGQLPYNGQTACPLLTCVCMLEPPKKGQPPNNGQNTRPQCVHCSEVPLYNVITQLMLTRYVFIFTVIISYHNVSSNRSKSDE